MIRTLLGILFLNKDIIVFDAANTAITAKVITKAVCTWTVTANAEQMPRTCRLIGFEAKIGSVSITLTDVQTATFTPEVLKYDVLLVDGSGNKEYYLEGTIFVSEGYTSTWPL